MPIEDELSEEEMHSIKIKELSDLILRAHSEAKESSKSYGDTLQEKWSSLGIDHNYFRIYLYKYLRNDNSVARDIRNYLVDFKAAELNKRIEETNQQFLGEIRKMNYIMYAGLGFGMLSIFSWASLIPAGALYVAFAVKKYRLRMAAEHEDLQLCFKEADVESLKELLYSDLREAVELCRPEIQKNS